MSQTMYSGIITKTTETAIQCLVYLTLWGDENTLLSPRQIAEDLELSPSYLSKVTGLLSRANILRAQRGVAGGVRLRYPPEQIKLLDIVEACQGKISGNYCQETDTPKLVCGFHQAMLDLYEKTVGVLTKWTLADLARLPGPDPKIAGGVNCRLGKVGELARGRSEVSSAPLSKGDGI